ncbi:tRNA (guanine-N(7)-)-methyltransferase non-catalytic subunit wuho [Leguminivora glycinivorella]|uniref:tRNA (guanine-N(7)-)-methyltransferase non-catalytic subunit wuho n=1 Tax=Leguminivora glycinivorella TaxID=1035111 RepID=UPI00200E839D|nr:tRNA (guanine-N(7)-)-methyltransferase non-catalytic subunit wuho [Leguminivora glycinivorella]
MSSIAVNDNYIAVAKGMRIDRYDSAKHDCINIPISKPLENDCISDIVISPDCKYLAVVSSVSKQLTVFELPLWDNYKSFTLPRSASKIRFTSDNKHLLVADKTGDVLLYDINNPSDSGTKLLGHLSLLLDVLQTNDGKYIITSDRDEKIKVSSYPNTYNIQTYCLGHKEFVKHIEILPHDENYLTSTSGDGTIKIWDYLNGRLVHTIDANDDIKDAQLLEDFVKVMNDDEIEVEKLPIVHYTISRLDDNSSLLVVAVHTSNALLPYKIESENNHFNHKLLERITVERFPAAIKLYDSSLYLYDDMECTVQVLKIEYKENKINIQSDKVIKMFEKDDTSIDIKDNNESIKLLYKRKFDNVQEYQERKKQRLEKSVS